MSPPNWDAGQMLDAYVHDYLVKRKYEGTARAFKEEANVAASSVVMDAPGGFLFEWWSVFWDLFIARTNDRHSEAATSYLKIQSAKALLPKQQHLETQQIQQMQGQQLSSRKDVLQQQKQRDGAEQPRGAFTGHVCNDALRSKCITANAMAMRTCEEISELLRRETLENNAKKQSSSNTINQLLDQNPASMLKPDALRGQLLWETSNDTSGASVKSHQTRNLEQHHPVSKSTKSKVNATRNLRASPAGSFLGVQGRNQDGNMLTLKGWPLTGLDQLGVPQHYKMMQAPQSLNELLLQQQLFHRAPQNAASSSINSMEHGTLRALLYGQEIGGATKASYSGIVPGGIGSSIPVAIPLVPLGNAELPQPQTLLQGNGKQLQQGPKPFSSSQRSQNPNQLHQQKRKLLESGSTTDGTMSNSLRRDNQASRSQIGRKRKQTESLPGAVSSSRTKITAAPSPSSPTPAANSPGNVVSVPNSSENSGSSKSLLMLGSHGLSTLVETSEADMDHLVENKTCDETGGSYFSHDVADQKDEVDGSDDTSNEIQSISASTSEIECCEFSSDGKLLATGGRDKLVTLWCSESFTVKSILEGHTQCVTSVCFSPSMSHVATSSIDRTVRVWDVDNPGYSLRTFVGHSAPVMSVDFYPGREDIVCSCDNHGDLRYWSINNGTCAGLVKGATKMSFQPLPGRLMATSTDNSISIIDVETQVRRCKLQEHNSPILSLCWNSSGEYLASVSDDLVRLWSTKAGSKYECVHELSSTGNKFHTSAFHPTHPSVLVIGCDEQLKFWNFSQGKTTTVNAHDKLISALAVSEVSRLVASASHDKHVKLWK